MACLNEGDSLEVVIVGVGGQGVITLARILGEAGLTAGIETRVEQLHGMSQRGGSVEATVRYGLPRRLPSPDVLLALEPLELLRALPRISDRTAVIASTTKITPFVLTLEGKPYPPPAEIFDLVREAAAELTVVDSAALLEELGDPEAINALMLGALAGTNLLPVGVDALVRALEESSSPAVRARSNAAFTLGRRATREE